MQIRLIIKGSAAGRFVADLNVTRNVISAQLQGTREVAIFSSGLTLLLYRA